MRVLAAVRETILVRILTLIQDAVRVGVIGEREGLRLLLEPGREPIAVDVGTPEHAQQDREVRCIDVRVAEGRTDRGHVGRVLGLRIERNLAAKRLLELVGVERVDLVIERHVALVRAEQESHRKAPEYAYEVRCAHLQKMPLAKVAEIGLPSESHAPSTVTTTSSGSRIAVAP